MPSLKQGYVAFLCLSIPPVSLAFTQVTGSSGFVSFATHPSNDNTCPANLPFATINNHDYCCPGLLVVFNAGNFNSQTDFDARAVCCVGGKDGTDTDTVSFCPGFPICSGTESPAAAMTIQTPVCVTQIPVTASDYTSLVVAAEGIWSGKGGATKVVTASASKSNVVTVAGVEGTTASGGTSTSIVTAHSSSSTGSGAPAVTAKAWVKGFAGAGAAFAVMGGL